MENIINDNEIEIGSEEYLRNLSEKTLSALTAIADEAANSLRSETGSQDALAVTQSFTGSEATKNLQKSIQIVREGYRRLQQEPAVARIIYEDEGGDRHTLYISRTVIVAGIPDVTLASVRSPKGRLASLEVGDSASITINGEEQELILVEAAVLRPKKDDLGWDSIDTIYRHEEAGTKTIASLRQLITSVLSEGDSFEEWLQSESENVSSGVIHQIRTAMGLRDQPILDKFQDEIFRLPLNSQLFIAGPPGTGKTTTLIKRLGQKLDSDYLTPEEKGIIERSVSNIDHRQSWLMFTPTELLKHYVKEAFAREEVPASEEHIRTWDHARRDLARNAFGLLQSGSDRGKFILKVEDNYLLDRIDDESHAWFDQFYKFYKQETVKSIYSAVDQAETALGENGKALAEFTAALKNRESMRLSDIFNSIEKAEASIQPLITTHNDAADTLATKSVRALLQDDREIFPKLANFYNEQASLADDDYEELEDIEEEDEASPEIKQLSPQQAAKRLMRQFKSIGRSKYLSRSIGKGSMNALVVDFLGELVPDDETFKSIGRSALIVSSLRRIKNAHRYYITDVARLYKRFRRDHKEFYREVPQSQHICPAELDAVILMTLKNAHDLMTIPFIKVKLDDPKFNYLARISSKFRNQILVDEATDFSPVQLACMQYLSSPEVRSFFACGDFNQRLTREGAKSRSQLEWLPWKIDYKTITTVYRQSETLNHLSRTLLAIFGGDDSIAGELPKDLNHVGVPPVFIEDISDLRDIADWLADRIEEIEASVQQFPTVGVLVDDEEQVQPLAEALGQALEELNIEAEACVEGKSLGDKNGVRVFAAEHIKGLEFEAVFFVNVDKLADKLPTLFDKYLYVGVTRAATYLGLTASNSLPDKLESIRPMLSDRWSD